MAACNSSDQLLADPDRLETFFSALSMGAEFGVAASLVGLPKHELA